MDFEFQHLEIETGMTDDGVEQMLILAERLREANGGELDDSAVLAVAEATGAPVEYVRLAVKLRSEKEKKSFASNLSTQFRTLEPYKRRFLLSGAAATTTALLYTLDERLVHSSGVHLSDYGIFSMIASLCAVLGIYNVFLSRDLKTAGISGALLAGGAYLMRAVFEYTFGIPAAADSGWFLPVVCFGAAGGVALHHFAENYRGRLGLKDPAKERQDLLKQLNRLHDKLSSGVQFMTFLSVDIVGSTRMKETADPLAVEYTFNEYHEYVTRVSIKYGGRLHSTAGDGVACAFEHPQHAFAAAKNIQAGLLELNTLRNRLGTPIVLRCGIHVGPVMTPEGGDVKSVNFAHVIDIASHLQKAAPPGGVAVSDAAVAQIAGGAETVGPVRIEAMDIGAFVWMQKSGPIFSSPSPVAHPQSVELS